MIESECAITEEKSEIDNAIYCAKYGNEDRLRLLLQAEPSLINTAVDGFDDGLLHLAAWHEHLEVALMLIKEFDISVNKRNKLGATPLHRACARNCIEIVALLLDNGADYNIKDNASKLPEDHGDVNVRKIIDTRKSHDREEAAYFAQKIKEADELWSESQKLKEEEKIRDALRRRHLRACSVVIGGAKHQFLNGAYDPIEGLSQDGWPVYYSRRIFDIALIFNAEASEWHVVRGLAINELRAGSRRSIYSNPALPPSENSSPRSSFSSREVTTTTSDRHSRHEDSDILNPLSDNAGLPPPPPSPPSPRSSLSYSNSPFTSFSSSKSASLSLEADTGNDASVQCIPAPPISPTSSPRRDIELELPNLSPPPAHDATSSNASSSLSSYDKNALSPESVASLKILIRMLSDPPTYPELRHEGGNGIIEFCDIENPNRRLSLRRRSFSGFSGISIETEDAVIAHETSLMMKMLQSEGIQHTVV